MRKSCNALTATAVVCALCVFPLFGCGGESDTPKPVETDGVFDWHTEQQAEYLSSSDYNVLPTDVNGKAEKSRPRPLTLEWTGGGDCESYTVEVSQNDDFSDSLTYKTTGRSIELYNLCVESAYAWRVTANGKNGKTYTSEPSYFFTAGVAPRNMYVDGVTNVRDLGGYRAGETRVKQGMIYRCGRLNKSKQPDVEIEITERGIATMKGEMGVKTEVDLRRPDNNNETGGITSSPLGAGVNYINIPMEFDRSDPILGNMQAVIDMFAVLGNASNYPLIFHCDIGTDRTGLFAFLINGLLGVSEDDLYRDYMFSNFGNIGGSRSASSIKNKYVNNIKAFEGATLSEKIKNYLVVKIGVEESDINALLEIMSA